jgi:uncharacterized membrane protein YfhO
VVLLQELTPTANVPLATDPAEVTVTDYTPLRVTAQLRGKQPGWLVLADTWYPGWKATVDGRPTKLFRANAMMRAVLVAEGNHRVEFYFSSASIRIGAIVSGLTIAGVILVLLTKRWRQHRSKPPCSTVHNG